MSDLVIKLSGEIQQSNFDEWKSNLIGQLESVKTDLASDSDFASATKHVKVFKKAEKSLKSAKSAALKQASDINDLFAAIDAVAKQTRSVRLELERQIKSRKASIKVEAVEKAIDKVNALIDQQSDDFRLLDRTEFTDRAIFVEAIKGTRGRSGMEKALDEVCTQLESKISRRAETVKQNATTLDSLSTAHQIAFQDRGFLLKQAATELDGIIDQRIEKLEKLAQKNSDSAAAEVVQTDSGAGSVEEGSDVESADVDAGGEDSKSAGNEVVAEVSGDIYQITLHIRGSEALIFKTMDEIKKQYREQPGFVEVTLKAE